VLFFSFFAANIGSFALLLLFDIMLCCGCCCCCCGYGVKVFFYVTLVIIVIGSGITVFILSGFGGAIGITALVLACIAAAVVLFYGAGSSSRAKRFVIIPVDD